MNSLERRLQLGLAATLFLLMSMLGLLMNSSARQLTEGYALTRLQHDGESLLAAITIKPDGKLDLDQTRLPAIYRQPLSGHYFQVYLDGSEALTSRSLWDNRLEANPLPTGASRQWHSPGPANQPLLLWASGYAKEGRSLTLVLAEDLTALQASLERYSLGFTALTIITLLALLLLLRHIVRRSLAPLQRLSHELDQLERGEIEQLTEAVPQEIQPLVREVNRLLSLMGQRLQRSRTALGNLAHALKGPLNLLTQLADDEASGMTPQLRKELLSQTGRLRQLIEHELKRARLAGGGTAAQRFDAAIELPPLIELLKRIYSDKSLQFDSHYPPSPIHHIDRNDLLEVIGNLLDNACKWAKGRITLRIEQKRGLSIWVEDDGPGVTGEALALLSQRGSRLDETVQGHGLGLSIVAEVAELYHGKLIMGRSERLGGFRVGVELPTATSTT